MPLRKHCSQEATIGGMPITDGMSDMSLTARQARFVAEYLIDLNATQAAIRAGYSEKTAEQQGPRLLGNVGVAAAIHSAQAKRAQRTEITQDRVLKELARIGFADLRKAVTWGEAGVVLVDSAKVDEDTALAVSEVSQGPNGLKIKMHDKLAALEKIGRHLGMFKDGAEDQGDAPALTVNISAAAPVGEIRVTRPGS